MKEEGDRRRQVTGRRETDIERWSDARQLDPAWEKRAVMAADFVPAGSAVLDLGCGTMALERLLPAGSRYIPCDVVERDERTILCDFNKNELPGSCGATIVSVLGVLEYIYDVPAFLRKLKACNLPVVLSYNPTDFTADLDRPSLGWVNHLSFEELISALYQAGFAVTTRQRIDLYQVLLKLTPSVLNVLEPRKVLVMSYNNVGNFGDRLGYHLINGVLPASVEVTHAHFHPWDVPDEKFDLLVLGIGNSLFAPLMTDHLLNLLDRVPCAVGIFGTQYRESIDSKRLAAILDRLVMWFARYEEDFLLYGKGRPNVEHFGDWLVGLFPMAMWREDRTFIIGQEICEDLPLDRTIQRIQTHRCVFSDRVHALLCALTSAERVAYLDQRKDGTGRPSGKFRSLFMDVFGRNYREGEYFDVQRDAVCMYKVRMQKRIDHLRAFLARLL